MANRRTVLLEEMFSQIASPRELEKYHELYTNNHKGVAVHLALTVVKKQWKTRLSCQNPCCKDNIKIRNKPNRIKLNGRLTPRLRWLILERDNHRCFYCGATPLEGQLHVDHIIPTSKGGYTLPDNLVTACRDCNLGKGALSTNYV